MAKHIVTLPKGKKITVTAPKDATDDEVFDFALSHLLEAHDASLSEKSDKIKSLNETIKALAQRVTNLENKMKPSVNVMTDPMIASAMVKMNATLDKLSDNKSNVKDDKKQLSFDLVHETDRNSPRFGRLVSVVPKYQ